MISGKILDRVDEPLDAPEEPSGNRFLHPPPLQIKPGSIPNMKRALWVGNARVDHVFLIHCLQDRTNSILPPADFISPHMSVNV
jgi:hypothetical protein